MAEEKRKKKVLVTGFGPFGTFTVNPSSVVLERLRDSLGCIVEHDRFSLDYQIVDCDYSEALKLCRHLNVDFSIHIGVNNMAKSICLESRSFAHGYDRSDVRGNLPHLNCCDFPKVGSSPNALPNELCTSLNLAAIRDSVKNNPSLEFNDVEISNETGRYLCAFIYYNALLHNNRCSLFIHIPDFDSETRTPDSITKAVAQIVLAVLDQISK